MKLVERAKAIMLRPREEWLVIEREPGRLSDLFSYVAILAAIPEIANFIGQSLIGGYKPIVPTLLRAVLVYVMTFAMVYSHTPLWLAGIFLAVPGLSFLLILGLYGLYLLWVGLPLLTGVPRYRALSYAIFVTVCALIPATVLAIV